MFGFVRVGAAIPKLKVADCSYNTSEILNIIEDAVRKKVKVLVFPELSITSYTCADLFMQTSLISSSLNALEKLLAHTKNLDIFIAVGLPLKVDDMLFNCIVAIHKGSLLGVVPKTYLPNYSEFYEKRWFSSSTDVKSKEIRLCSQIVPFGNDLIFECENNPTIKIGIEICEDLWAPIPPSSILAMRGATILLNGSASNEIVTKHEYRKNLVASQSASTIGAYVYSSAGIGESTQDLVFSGHSMICENGSILSESKRFSKDNQLIISDIDTEFLSGDRCKNTTFMSFINNNTYIPEFRKISFNMNIESDENLYRFVNPQPFVPKNDLKLNERCEDIFNIQLNGLAKRVNHTKAKHLVIGISGGLDSTLALLVAVKACDFLSLNRKTIIGVTMPGFGTTDRTYNNAINLMKSLGIELREISIKDASIQHFKDINHDMNIHDVTYENTQARERTQILMDIANQENGLVVGTGDLSELALGWATYNGDHMSMYGVNAGVPKTLVRALVSWVANSGELDDESKDILHDVLDTPVSPELLPPDKEGNINQKTEELVGPYILHDFFLYYVVRCGFSPKKIFYIAKIAFKDEFDDNTILKWLRNFYNRFFSQQFKRSCLPDGPKVGTISLSPRGDWRMPSDAMNTVWIKELDEIDY